MYENNLTSGGDPSQTTLTPWETYYFAFREDSDAIRIKDGEWDMELKMRAHYLAQLVAFQDKVLVKVVGAHHCLRNSHDAESDLWWLAFLTDEQSQLIHCHSTNTLLPVEIGVGTDSDLLAVGFNGQSALRAFPYHLRPVCQPIFLRCFP